MRSLVLPLVLFVQGCGYSGGLSEGYVSDANACRRAPGADALAIPEDAGIMRLSESDAQPPEIAQRLVLPDRDALLWGLRLALVKSEATDGGEALVDVYEARATSVGDGAPKRDVLSVAKVSAYDVTGTASWIEVSLTRPIRLEKAREYGVALRAESRDHYPRSLAWAHVLGEGLMGLVECGDE